MDDLVSSKNIPLTRGKPSSAKIAWTQRSIDALRVTKRQDFIDPKQKRLVLRVMPSGTKSWSLVYRRKADGKKRRFHIGEFPQLGLADARAEAAKRSVAIASGSDPAGEATNRRKAETLDQLLDLFLAEHPKPTAAWTKEMRRLFAKDVRPPLGGVKLRDIRRVQVRGVLKAVQDRGATVTVNRTLAALRRAFSWAIAQDLLEHNPASNIDTEIDEQSRDRALDQPEIARFWNRLGEAGMSERSRIALRLVLCTGARPGEVVGARKAEIDLQAGLWTIPSTRAKNRQTHVLPLSRLALDLFQQAIELSPDGEIVFISRPQLGRGTNIVKPMESHALSHALRNALPKLGFEDTPFRPHDLRRSAATHLARLGVPDFIVGRLLNHGTEVRRTITAKVYLRHDYLAEKRMALDRWASELRRIVGDEPAASNIVQLRLS